MRLRARHGAVLCPRTMSQVNRDSAVRRTSSYTCYHAYATVVMMSMISESFQHYFYARFGRPASAPRLDRTRPCPAVRWSGSRRIGPRPTTCARSFDCRALHDKFAHATVHCAHRGLNYCTGHCATPAASGITLISSVTSRVALIGKHSRHVMSPRQSLVYATALTCTHLPSRDTDLTAVVFGAVSLLTQGPLRKPQPWWQAQ